MEIIDRLKLVIGEKQVTYFFGLLADQKNVRVFNELGIPEGNVTIENFPYWRSSEQNLQLQSEQLLIISALRLGIMAFREMLEEQVNTEFRILWKEVQYSLIASNASSEITKQEEETSSWILSQALAHSKEKLGEPVVYQIKDMQVEIVAEKNEEKIVIPQPSELEYFEEYFFAQLNAAMQRKTPPYQKRP